MFLLISNPTIRRLFMAQALYWSCAVICVLLATLIGLKLAPLKELASLPLALFVLGNLLALQPISRVMARYGRRTGFLLGAAAGALGGLTSAASLWLESFFLFCLSAMPIGAYQASAMYYRFAALETVEFDLRGRAAAAVVGAGVVAAVIAPSLGSATRDLLTVPFAGAYLLVAAMALTGALTLSGLPAHKTPQAHSSKPSPTRWRELVKRPVIKAAILTTATGHGLMTLVMNATPLAMHGEGMTLEASGTVIQWHMLGMFRPAFLAGPLVDRYGARAVACLGAVLLMTSALNAYHGVTHMHFLSSSFLLGVGWCLMLVAGTTQLAFGYEADERANAQGLMELTNGAVAAVMSFTSGAVIAQAGWTAVNSLAVPFLLLVVVVQLVQLGSENKADCSANDDGR